MGELLPKGAILLNQNNRKRCPKYLREEVIRELYEIYKNPPWGSCVGMAAPQIGYDVNIFVVLGCVFENVVWYKGIGSKVRKHEGCFSVPHEWHTVDRYETIKIRIGNKYMVLRGWPAQVFQHEYDHIEGKLINENSRHEHRASNSSRH